MGTKAIRPEFSVTLLAMGIALAATPALSQVGMTPRPDVAPRVAPAAPPPPPTVAPTPPPVAPTIPIIPNVSGPAPGNPAKVVRKAGGEQIYYLKAPGDAGGGPSAIGGTPIQGTDVGLDGIPPSRISTGKTDATGAVTFTNLKPGQYTFTLPGRMREIGQNVRLTSKVDGKLQSRADFPLGSGGTVPLTLTVAGPKDVVVVKLEKDEQNNILMEVSTTRLGASPGGGGPAAPAGLRGGFIIPAIAIVAMIGPGGASVPGTTDATGQHSFQNLPAGRYTARLQGKDLPAGVTGRVAFVATVNGKETARTTFDVPAGGAGTRSFDLPFDVGPPPAGIKGTTVVVALLAVR